MCGSLWVILIKMVLSNATRFGQYKIMCDTIAPTISLLSKGQIISLRVKR